MNTQKPPSWYANTNIYLVLHLLVVIEKRETAYENRVNCFS